MRSISPRLSLLDFSRHIQTGNSVIRGSNFDANLYPKWVNFRCNSTKFKSINDTYGHPVGDIVLKKLVEAVASALRKTDVLGRLGGEEFGVVLPGTDIEGATILGERILDAVRACTVSLPEKPLRFTISLGISELGAPPDNLEAAFKRADQALYEAKQSGRNRLRIL